MLTSSPEDREKLQKKLNMYMEEADAVRLSGQRVGPQNIEGSTSIPSVPFSAQMPPVQNTPTLFDDISTTLSHIGHEVCLVFLLDVCSFKSLMKNIRSPQLARTLLLLWLKKR